jgi:glycosyltransferase involved in cell wall biosynthesis
VGCPLVGHKPAIVPRIKPTEIRLERRIDRLSVQKVDLPALLCPDTQHSPKHSADLNVNPSDWVLPTGLVGMSLYAERRDIYLNLDICVVPSRSQDPLPKSAIEAGFSGLPVIATLWGGLPVIVEHGTNGPLVNAKRPAELADAMCRVIDVPFLRQHLAANARRCATERFGRERFLAEFLALLEGQD